MKRKKTRLESYNDLIEARRLAFRYEGTFPFMLEMQHKAFVNRNWLPSKKQAKAIMNCVRREIDSF